jgi:hypothetical protein
MDRDLKKAMLLDGLSEKDPMNKLVLTEELKAMFENVDSIELKKGSNGKYAWSVKLYCNLQKNDSEALVKLFSVEERIKERFGK